VPDHRNGHDFPVHLIGARCHLRIDRLPLRYRRRVGPYGRGGDDGDRCGCRGCRGDRCRRLDGRGRSRGCRGDRCRRLDGRGRSRGCRGDRCRRLDGRGRSRGRSRGSRGCRGGKTGWCRCRGDGGRGRDRRRHTSLWWQGPVRRWHPGRRGPGRSGIVRPERADVPGAFGLLVGHTVQPIGQFEDGGVRCGDHGGIVEHRT
jgi:hypothetical protein